PMPALLTALVAGIAYLAIGPSTADLAAQTYRAELFDRVGFVLWDNAWYGGHHMPGYSLLYPPLGALFGPRLTAVLATIAATAAFTLLVRGHRWGMLAACWFAVAVSAAMFSGRVPFVVGVAFAVGAALAAQRDRLAVAA